MKMHTNKKAILIKAIIVISIVYVCIYLLTNATTTSVFRGLQESGRNFAAYEELQSMQSDRKIRNFAAPKLNDGSVIIDNAQSADNALIAENAQVADVAAQIVESAQFVENAQSVEAALSENARFIDTVQFTEVVQNASEIIVSKEQSLYDKVRELTKCLDKPMVPKTQQRGDYWVLYNYIRAERSHTCSESITYTTHGDYSFLDNLVPLLERWQGPISIALHAPGSDFKNTLDSIAYLRECTTPLVKEYVTFHVYFSTKHVPKEVPKSSNVFSEPFNCSAPAPFANVNSDNMYKAQKKLLYPVNVGRNIARETAQTHFLLPSDIELYPSPKVIPQFLTMIAENTGPLLNSHPKVFPLTIFEVAANMPVPETKTELVAMLRNGSALPFHKKLCPGCHGVPKAIEWQKHAESPGVHVFHVGKRTGKFVHWEPIFIGTHADPMYDERLSWEGKSDKMTQGYALCVLDYEFLILDNAFLVHKPGIKVYKRDHRRDVLASKTNQLINKIIYPELKVMYGVRKGCAV